MIKQINIGQLDRKVNIYETTKVKSSSGEYVETEVLFKNCWVKSEDKSAKEEEDGKIWLYAIRNYTIRYDFNVVLRGEQMYIRDIDGDYYVTGIIEEGRKKYLILKTMKRE